MDVVDDNKLNKFERTRLLSARALQISENAPLFTKAETEKDSYELAKNELKDNKVPLKVVRRTVKEETKIIAEEVN